jgi:hypothetical protein
MGIDLTSEVGIAAWREHSVEFILSAVRATGHDARSELLRALDETAVAM